MLQCWGAVENNVSCSTLVTANHTMHHVVVQCALYTNTAVHNCVSFSIMITHRCIVWVCRYEHELFYYGVGS